MEKPNNQYKIPSDKDFAEKIAYFKQSAKEFELFPPSNKPAQKARPYDTLKAQIESGKDSS